MDFLHKLFTRLKRGALSYKNYIRPNALIVLLAVTVSGFNITMFNGGKIYTDKSLAAQIITNNPKLNPRLAEKLTQVRLASQNQQVRVAEAKNDSGNIFVKTAYAANLTDDDQSDKKPFEYEVQGGDTLSSIAKQYDLNLNTVLWANNLTAKSIIRPGQKLTLLPVDGVLYTIKKGDTIGKIAGLYEADTQKVMDYNDINDATKIHAGDVIIIPDGQPLPKTPDNNEGNNAQDHNPPSVTPPVAAGSLIWPTTTRNITQKYSATHRGIDISNGSKPPILAAHSGTVEFAGTSGDWGKTILIRGDDGLVTRYSHASGIDVAAGDPITAGQQIGIIGNTGRVRGRTGLHLDFRVYKNGVAINPLNLLQ
jgi:murein DD-endopeptidase MepM/ murein hydrolase activator NlpD